MLCGSQELFFFPRPKKRKRKRDKGEISCPPLPHLFPFSSLPKVSLIRETACVRVSGKFLSTTPTSLFSLGHAPMLAHPSIHTTTSYGRTTTLLSQCTHSFHFVPYTSPQGKSIPCPALLWSVCPPLGRGGGGGEWNGQEACSPCPITHRSLALP